MIDPPFRHLSVKISLKDWRSRISKSLDERQSILDNNCSLLSDESHEFFRSLNVKPKRGFLWSWIEETNANKIYHVDGNVGDPFRPLTTINLFLDGSPSLTEWAVDRKKLKIINSEGYDAEYGAAAEQFQGDVAPDFSESIKKEFPMMVRSDVPHRVRPDLIKQTRWTYNIKLVDPMTELPLNWGRSKKVFKDYIKIEL